MNSIYSYFGLLHPEVQLQTNRKKVFPKLIWLPGKISFFCSVGSLGKNCMFPNAILAPGEIPREFI